MNDHRPSEFGAQLRRYREAAGLSQEELAERASLTAAAVGALERGERRRPYPHTVQVLATALDLDGDRRAALIATIPRRGDGAWGGPPQVHDERTPPVGRRPTAFVGRRAELAVLEATLADAAGGRGGIVQHDRKGLPADR